MANKKIKGLTVEIGGDSTKLGKALDDSKKKSKSLQTELRQVERLLKMDPGNVELLAQKQKILTDQVDETKKRLTLMKEEQEKVNQLYKNGEIGEADYRKYQREVEQTRLDLEKLEGQLKETGDKFSEVQRKSGAVNFKNAEDKAAHLKGVIKDMADSAVENMEKVSKKAETVGDGLEKAGSVLNKGSAAAAAVLAGSVASFKDLDNGYDIIVKKTGATEGAFDSLKATADEIFSGSVFDMTDIGAAIGEVNTRFGYTDEVLRSVSEQYLQFAKINDADVSDSVAKTARIMQAWDLSAENLPDLLGMITAKGQETGVAVGSLMDKVLDNNATFKEMGLSLEESISLMAQFEKNGINDSTALMALKTSVKNATKEGKSLSEALTESVSDIKNATTDTEALQKATELFGTRGAAEMATAIREGRINFDDLSGSMTDYKDTVKNTYTATLDPLEESKQVLNNLKLAGADLAATALKEGKPLIDDVVKGIKGVTDWFKKLSPEQKKVLTKAIEITAVVGPGVTILGKLTKGVGSFVGTGAKLVKSLQGATAAQSGLNVAMNANPAGAVILAITALATAFVGLSKAIEAANEQRFEDLGFNAQADRLQETLDKVNEIKDRVKETKDGLDQSFQNSSENIGIIDDYKSRLDELLKKSDWSGAEAQELKTIGQYFSDKSPDFQKAWDEYIKIDDNGKVEITGDINEIQGKLDELINKYKKVASSQALSNMATQNTEAYFNMQSDVNDSAQQMLKARQELQDFMEEWNFDQDDLNLPDFYTWQSTGKVNGYKSQATVGDLKKQWQTLTNATNEADKAYSEITRTAAQLKVNNEDLARMQAVVNGDYSDATAVLMAYNKELINSNDIAQSKWKSLDNLKTKASELSKETGANIVYGMNNGVTEYLGEIQRKGVETAQEYLNSVTGVNGLDEHSPSKKMFAIGENAVQGMIDGVGNKSDNLRKAGQNAAEKVRGGTESVSLFNTGKNFVSGFINGLKDGTGLSNIWNTAKNVASTALNAVKNFLGINSPSKEAEKLGSFFGEGFSNGITGEKRNVAISAEDLASSARKALQSANIYDFDRLTARVPGYISDSPSIRDQSDIKALSAKMDVLIDKMDAIARKEQGIYLDGNILVGRTVERMDDALYRRAVNRERGV